MAGQATDPPPGFDPKQMRVPQTLGPPGGSYPPVGAPFSYCPPAREPGLEESGPCYRALEWSQRQAYGPENDFVQVESEVECRSSRSSQKACPLPPGYVVIDATELANLQQKVRRMEKAEEALKEAQQLPDPVVVAQAPECQQVYEEMLCRQVKQEVACATAVAEAHVHGREPARSAPLDLRIRVKAVSIPAFC